jgi:EAL domain-containing protein (putative c-di-GMP-specific phosphodiesterase class I)
VNGINENPRNQEILRTITNLARNLGMDVVAEGVEREDQLAQLLLLPCGFGQGFYFSEALDGEGAGKLLSGRLGPRS